MIVRILTQDLCKKEEKKKKEKRGKKEEKKYILCNEIRLDYHDSASNRRR